MVAHAPEQSFAYDDNGNIISDGTTGNTFKWDAENRLAEIDYTTPGDVSKFYYDGLGRLLQIAESGSVTATKNFVWCGAERCQERDEFNAVKKEFFGFGEKLGASAYCLTFDHLGSVREITDADASATVEGQYNYSPFGEQTKIAGTGPDADFGFAGMYVHPRSGLNLTMFRAYSPQLGRWLSRDPLGEAMGTNLYAYVGNSPTNYRDPSGAAGEQALALLGGATAGPLLVGGTGVFGLGMGLTDILSGRMSARISPSLQTLTGPQGWFGPNGLGVLMNQQDSGGNCPAKPGAASPEDIANRPDSTPMKPVRNGTQVGRPGGMEGAVDDVNAMGPSGLRPIQSDYGPGFAGDLPGGGSVSIRPGNSDNPTQPTVQANQGGKVWKYRY